jgi:hypothetical protein
MASIVPLHPSVRERHSPQISAAALAEYLILLPDAQDTVLHNSRFLTPSVVAPYSDAMRALRAYNSDPHRTIDALNSVKAALTKKSGSAGVEPWPKAEALRCVEAIELFQKAENAMGMKGLPLSTTPRFEALSVNGVALSVQPDLLIRVEGAKGARLGAVMLRLAKAPDPNDCVKEKTRTERLEHRRELAAYLAAMMQMLLEREAREGEVVDRGLIFVADVRLGERIGAAGDHAARIKSITAACGQVRRLWATIEPRPAIRAKLAQG